MRVHVLFLALLVAPACTSAERVERVDVEDAQPRPAAPVPYGALIDRVPQPDAIDHVSTSLTVPAFGHAVAPIMATSFEPASPDCNDWEADGADAIRSVPPHSGTYACRICATGDVPVIALAHGAGPVLPGRYVLTAWVRRRPHHDAPADVTALLEADTADGMVTASSPLAPGDEYAKVLVTLDLARPASAIRARITAAASATQCVLIDDVLLERVL